MYPREVVDVLRTLRTTSQPMARAFRNREIFSAVLLHPLLVTGTIAYYKLQKGISPYPGTCMIPGHVGRGRVHRWPLF